MEKELEDLFVPYDIALELKKRGFNEFCFSAYRNSDGEKQLMALAKWKNSEIALQSTESCAAPIYQQAIDFIGAHGIDVFTKKYYTSNELINIKGFISFTYNKFQMPDIEIEIEDWDERGLINQLIKKTFEYI